MSPLQLMLEELKKREIYHEGVPTQLVDINSAAELLELLEIKMLNEYGRTPEGNTRQVRQDAQDQARIIGVGNEQSKELKGENY